MLKSYLISTRRTKSYTLFVDPVDLKHLSIHKIRLLLCKYIRLADPGAFPKSHDLRKLASSYAFLKSLSFEQIKDVTGWSSCQVFRKHYFKKLQEVGSSFIALGSRVSRPENV